MFKRLLSSAPVQAALAWTIGAYLDLALRTTRWVLLGEEAVAPHMAGVPCIVAFWHERLPLMPMLWIMARRRRSRPDRQGVHVLVSRHRDGRLIGDVMRYFRMGAVHGSTSRGGPAGLRRLADLLALGDHIAITPDGPRGPRRQAAPGVAQLAAMAAVVVLPCAAQTTRRRVLGSWDRMVLPLPFGRGVIQCGTPIAVPRQGWEAVLPRIAEALTAAADGADRACGRA